MVSKEQKIGGSGGVDYSYHSDERRGTMLRLAACPKIHVTTCFFLLLVLLHVIFVIFCQTAGLQLYNLQQCIHRLPAPLLSRAARSNNNVCTNSEEQRGNQYSFYQHNSRFGIQHSGIFSCHGSGVHFYLLCSSTTREGFL